MLGWIRWMAGFLSQNLIHYMRRCVGYLSTAPPELWLLIFRMGTRPDPNFDINRPGNSRLPVWYRAWLRDPFKRLIVVIHGKFQEYLDCKPPPLSWIICSFDRCRNRTDGRSPNMGCLPIWQHGTPDFSDTLWWAAASQMIASRLMVKFNGKWFLKVNKRRKI